ncbi:MAG: redoxin family protein, partial [Candidatus Magasanikbacteria bacterium]|nr:redoxin family protein [Candidatus Magasanikbacteria bacterium]
SLVLFLVSLLGQKFTRGAAWAADPNGWFKRGLGILFLIVGVFILTGTDKKLQAYLLEKGYFNITNVEQKLLEKALPQEKASDNEPVSMKNYPRYREIANPSGFVNTEPFQIADLIGKKVILVDFMTYSCINCIRTFPYLNDWNDKYKDLGLVIVGIHTPEFAFEKKRENVVEAMKKYGITFPVVMDNDYGTWNAYQNSYWPRKYLIDLDGNIVYDHIGEGQYEETEMKIQELLKVKAKVSDLDKSDVLNSRSPETYFGSARNRTLVTSPTGVSGIANGVITKPLKLNALSLGGTWDIQPDFAVSSATQSQIAYRFDASEVYFVAASTEGQDVEVLLDGKSLTEQQAGEDIFFRDGKSYLRVQEERLYSLFRSTGKNESHDLELIVPEAGLEAYTFTFG